MTTIRLEAQIPTPEHRDLLFASLRDLLGNCTVDEVTARHVVEGARRIEWTTSHRVVLLVQPHDPPSFDLVSTMIDVCDLAGIDTWSMTTWAPVPHLSVSIHDRAFEF